MKKLRKFQLLIVFIVTIFHLSCSSTYSFVVDKNNPPDQNAIILFQSSRYIHFGQNYIRKSYKLKKWNDVNIKSAGEILIVPAGNNTITFDVSYFYEYNETEQIIENVKLQYDFEPGVEYSVKSESEIVREEVLYSGFIYYIVLSVRLYNTRNENTILEEWTVRKFYYLKNFSDQEMLEMIEKIKQ
jgi:hypothetical protein